METRGGAALVFLCALAQSASIQQPADRQIFRTGTDLAIIDAVVVDERGRHVRDLSADDFEVVQQGKTYRVRQALYISAGTAAPSAVVPPPDEVRTPAAAAPAASAAILSRNAAPRPDPRVLAIVVDDLGLSFESTAGVRRALTKFVNEEVGPGDLVAILRTSAGVGALQQFSTDKRLLHAAIERLQWTILSRTGVAAFAPVVPDGLPPATSATGEIEDENVMDGLRTSMSATGSLGALDFVIRGVESLSGRKSVVFISEGLRLFTKPEGMKTQGAGRVWNAFTRVMDRANRAGVVVYTMDARGLVSGGLSAEDNPRPAPTPPGRPDTTTAVGDPLGEVVTQKLKERFEYLRDTQEALTYVAEQTGGFAILNTNDLAAGLRRVRDDAAGYYLLGFEGAPAALRSWDPGRVTVRVTRPGLRVRARKGLFGPSDPGREPPESTGDSLIMAALSPFSAGALDVRLTALFAHDAKAGSFVRSLFFIDPAGVRFTRRDDGRHVAKLTVALLAIGDDGKMAAEWRRAIDLQLTDATYELARTRGILYTATVPLKRAGAYQLRVAVRDESSHALGSASQFVEVPTVDKGRVAISGIVLHAADATLLGEPALRIFERGAEAVYACEIYDGAADQGGVTAAVTILRDGKVVHREPPASLESRTGETAVTIVPVVGRVPLQNLAPGFYTLQITAARIRNGTPTPPATQWATFEVR